MQDPFDPFYQYSINDCTLEEAIRRTRALLKKLQNLYDYRQANLEKFKKEKKEAENAGI